MNQKKTLVYHAGALGDFITTLPAIRLWKTRYPNHAVVLLGKPEFGTLACDNDIVDEIWDINKKEYCAIFDENAQGNNEKLLAQFYSAVLFCADDSPLLTNIKKHIPDTRHQPPFPQKNTHVVPYHCSLINKNITAKNIAYLNLYQDCKKELPQRCKKTIALHPGSGSPRKNWAFNNFLEVRNCLIKSGHAVVWILGPAEEALEPPGEDSTVRNQPLPAVARALAKCQLFIGADSGIAHQAAAIDIPVIALFGPSDPAVWRPFGKNVSVIDAMPECRPCHPAWGDQVACHENCMEKISAPLVLNHCLSLL